MQLGENSNIFKSTEEIQCDLLIEHKIAIWYRRVKWGLRIVKPGAPLLH